MRVVRLKMVMCIIVVIQIIFMCLMDLNLIQELRELVVMLNVRLSFVSVLLIYLNRKFRVIENCRIVIIGMVQLTNNRN